MTTAAPKLTLDTNCIINLFDAGSATRTSVEQLQALMQAALSGKAEISITTRVEVDVSNDADAIRRQAILEARALFPIIGTVGRWGSSKWDSQDVFATKEKQALAAELQRIIFPALSDTDKRHRNKINDIDHLVGHLTNKRDIFITDDREIIKKHATLKESLGLVVMLPSEALRFIEDQPVRMARVEAKTLAGYHAPELRGTVTFDYSNNDGRFVVGSGHFAIETCWSKGSDTSIRAYKESPTTNGVAIAKGCMQFADISDATALDYTSRVRSPQLGEIVVWRNTNGIYGATRIVSIRDDTRGAECDELTFEYEVLQDGSSSFANSTKR